MVQDIKEEKYAELTNRGKSWREILEGEWIFVPQNILLVIGGIAGFMGIVLAHFITDLDIGVYCVTVATGGGIATALGALYVTLLYIFLVKWKLKKSKQHEKRD